jgi:hypothetical protein
MHEKRRDMTANEYKEKSRLILISNELSRKEQIAAIGELFDELIVPADQSYIPWRKFDIDEMPKKEFQFFGIMKKGTWIMDDWVRKINKVIDEWDTVAYQPSEIAYYCPIDEIPGPETE